MNEDEGQNSEQPEWQEPSSERSEPVTQEVQHSQVSALVPEGSARGVFSTGAVVLNGAHEFIIDFLLRMTKPHQVSARVVLSPAVIPRFIAALQENIQNYKRRFGAPSLPHPHPAPANPEPIMAGLGASESEQSGPQEGQASQLQQTSAQELYEQLKISDDELSGTYANAVMIGHTATEFSFDFITTFFPRSAVAKRVFLSAPNVPRLLDSLKHSFEQYQRKMAAQRPPNPPAPPQPRPPEEPPF